MLLETIEDLKQVLEQTEPKASTAQPFNIPSCDSCFDLQPLLLSGTHFNSCIFTGPGQVKDLALGDTKADLSSTPPILDSNLFCLSLHIMFKFELVTKLWVFFYVTLQSPEYALKPRDTDSRVH